VLASLYGHLDVVLLLLQNGPPLAQVPTTVGPHLVVRPPFFLASTPQSHRHHRFKSRRTNPLYNTSLHLASANRHLSIAEHPIQFGANANTHNRNQEPPLDLASGYGELAIVASTTHIRLDCKFARCRRIYSPLHQVAQSGHLDIVARLLRCQRS